MKTNDFLKDLQEQLEWSNPLAVDTNLKEAEEWDSLSAMILISFVNENFDVVLSADDLIEITTIESLINKIGSDKFEN